MQIYLDSDESDEDIKICQFELENDIDQSGLSVSQDEQKAYYSSELDEIKIKEFQNAQYLQEISSDGSKLHYEHPQFQYSFPLKSGKLYYQPHLRDIFEIETSEGLKTLLSYDDRNKNRRGTQNCVATAMHRVAIGFINPTGITLWNENTNSGMSVPIPPQDPYGDLVCMDFSNDSELLVCGFSSGTIGFVDSNRGILFQVFNEIHKERLLTIRFIYKFKEEQLVTASIDVTGSSAITNFNKGFFKYEVNPQPLFKKMMYPAAAMKYLIISEDVRLLAVANIQKFWIVRIKIQRNGENEMSIIVDQENPGKIQRNQVFSSCCAIGRGLVKTSRRQINRQFIAVCCWDKALFTVTSDSLSDIMVSKFIFLESQAIDCIIVKDSLYAIITKDKGILLMNSINILNFLPDRKLGECRYIDFPETSKIQYIGQDIRIKGFYMSNAQKRFRSVVQRMLKKTTLIIEDHPPTNYNPFFSGNVVILLAGSVIRATLDKWSKLVHTFYEQGEWMNGMHYILSVYLGSNRYITQFLELNKVEKSTLLKSIINDITFRYHKMVMSCLQIPKEDFEFLSEQQQQESKNNDYTIFSILIEFLLMTDSYELLFEQIMPQTKQVFKDEDEFFLICLEPFYQECLVQQIPNPVLLHILDIYKMKQRPDLIQKLIWSLDHSLIDTSHLIKLSLKLGLLKSLAIICSKGDAEVFLTPVVKIWSVILLMIDKNDFVIARYYCLRLLALIKSALQRTDVLGRSLDQNKSNEIVRTLANWLLNEENLEKLLSLQPAPTFEVLLLLLSGEQAKIVNNLKKFRHDEYNSEFVKQFDLNTSKSTVMVERITQKIMENQTNFQKQFRSSSICDTNTNSNVEKDFTEDLNMHYTLFQIRLFYNQYIDITNSRIINCLGYIFKNLRSLNYLYLSELLGYLPYARREEFRKHNNPKEVIEYLQSEYLLLVIKKLETNCIPSEHKAIIELSHLADLTTLSIACIHLAQKKKEYKRVLDFYLSSKNTLVRRRVFEWLFKIMEELQLHDETNFEEMKQALIHKITDLIQINSEKTRDIFSRFNSESEKVVINKLELYPELQLEYVENVLKKERDQDHKVDSDLLVLNISLLCRLNPDKILTEVKQFEYPLDNILQPCRQYGIRKATAYVLERLGNIQEAVHLYCELLMDVFKTHLKELNYNYDLSTKLGGVGNDKPTAISSLFNKAGAQNMMQTYELAKEKATNEINNEIETIIDICLFNNKFDSTDQIWYILMDSLIEIRDKYVTFNEAVSFLKDICTLEVCHIIATIAENSNLDILLKQLQERYVDLDLGQLKLTFIEIIHNYLYEQTVFCSAKQLIQTDILKKLFQVTIKYNKGIYGKYECAECHEELQFEGKYKGEADDNIIFSCQHAYHRGCAVEQQGLVLCQICCHKDENYAYKILFLNPKIKLDKLSEGLKIKQVDKEGAQLNDSDYQDLEYLMKKDDGIIKIKVSKDTEMKRKKRTNKLGFWDRKRLENLQLIEQTNEDIDSFTKRQKQEEERKIKQDLDAKAKRRKR